MKHDPETVSQRHSVNKSKSTAQFKRQAGKTKAANIQPGPMRGGWRL